MNNNIFAKLFCYFVLGKVVKGRESCFSAKGNSSSKETWLR